MRLASAFVLVAAALPFGCSIDPSTNPPDPTDTRARCSPSGAPEPIAPDDEDDTQDMPAVSGDFVAYAVLPTSSGMAGAVRARRISDGTKVYEWRPPSDEQLLSARLRLASPWLLVTTTGIASPVFEQTFQILRVNLVTGDEEAIVARTTTTNWLAADIDGTGRVVLNDRDQLLERAPNGTYRSIAAESPFVRASNDDLWLDGDSVSFGYTREDTFGAVAIDLVTGTPSTLFSEPTPPTFSPYVFGVRHNRDVASWSHTTSDDDVFYSRPTSSTSNAIEPTPFAAQAIAGKRICGWHAGAVEVAGVFDLDAFDLKFIDGLRFCDLDEQHVVFSKEDPVTLRSRIYCWDLPSGALTPR